MIKSCPKPVLSEPYSSLAEGDEQLDRPNSKTCMETYHVNTAYLAWIRHKHNNLPLCLIHSSSPSTKELHVQSIVSINISSTYRVSIMAE